MRRRTNLLHGIPNRNSDWIAAAHKRTRRLVSSARYWQGRQCSKKVSSAYLETMVSAPWLSSSDPCSLPFDDLAANFAALVGGSMNVEIPAARHQVGRLRVGQGCRAFDRARRAAG